MIKPVFVDGSVVAKLHKLHPEKIPEHLMRGTPTKATGDFDPNAYFTVLTHLKVKDGYTLDYVYHCDALGGYPCLYARPTDASGFDTIVDYRDWEKKNSLLSYIVADQTPDGFFQLVVFYRLAGQFYLYWHANYNDVTILTSREQVEVTVRKLNDEWFGNTLTEEQVAAIMNISPEPSVTLNETSADVTYCVFTQWGGFEQLKETFKRSPPHLIVGREVISAVEYDCGICF